MRKINNILRLVRFPNLLMVAVVMILMRYTVILPILSRYGLNSQLADSEFIILVLSTLLITAAGYLINDYHDVKADRINRPDTVIVDLRIPRRLTMIWHIILNTTGALGGVLISIVLKVPWLAVIFVFTPFLLWGYSARFKHMVLLGNVVVAIFTALVPLLVLFFEYPLLSRAYPEFINLIPGGFRVIVFWVGVFSFFAFMTTIIREIVKDAEDMEGDQEAGSRTLPLVWGLSTAKRVILVLSLLTLGTLIFFFIKYLNDPASLIYASIALLVPFIWLIAINRRAQTPREFRLMSLLLKVIMLMGMLYAPFAHFVISLYL